MTSIGRFWADLGRVREVFDSRDRRNLLSNFATYTMSSSNPTPPVEDANGNATEAAIAAAVTAMGGGWLGTIFTLVRAGLVVAGASFIAGCTLL